MRHLTGNFNLEVQTEDGYADFVFSKSFDLGFTAVSLSTGSLAGNIITLTTEGVSSDEEVVLKSGSTVVSQ